VLERLVRARLLTVDDSAVSLAHEALITGWPRLRAWVEEDRDRLRLHRRLTDAAGRWEELGRDAGALYRGSQLSAAAEALARIFGELTDAERDFLIASLTERDREQRAAARTTRRLRALTITLSVLLCLAAVAGLTAWQQSRISARRATEAEARRIAGVAETMRRSDPRTAMQLSVAAWRTADLPETREALFTAAAQRELDVFTPALPEFAPEDNRVWERLSEDGRTLTIVGPERTDRWDVSSHRRLPPYSGLGRYAQQIVAVSSDTRTIAVGTARGVRLWDLAAGRLTGPAFGPSGDDVDGWFTPGGRIFAVHRHGASLQLWDTRQGRLLLDTERPRPEIRKLDMSADDRHLVFCAGDEPLEVWDVHERRRLPTPWATKAKVWPDAPRAGMPRSKRGSGLGLCGASQVRCQRTGLLLGRLGGCCACAWALRAAYIGRRRHGRRAVGRLGAQVATVRRIINQVCPGGLPISLEPTRRG
jgi:hypothetical protein